MSWQVPKTDWKFTDYYNVQDLERVRDNLLYLQQQLVSLGYYSPELNEISTSNSYKTLPTVQLINMLEQNLQTIADTLGTWVDSVWGGRETWVSILSANYMRNPNSGDWNRWEQLTQVVYDSIQYLNVYLHYRIAGTFYAGSNNLVQTFSRGR